MANATPATTAPKPNAPPPPAPPAAAAAPLATTNGTPPAGNAITVKKQGMDRLKDLLDKAKPSMQAVLPKTMTPEKLVKLALVAAVRNPDILKCNVQSVVQAVMNAAQLGLDCSGVLGSAYLVPYGANCTLIIGYRGFIDLARRSGEIDTIEAHVVRKNDTFKVAYGLEPSLFHEPCLSGDPGEMVLVYAIARLKDGGRQVEVMTRVEVEKIRNRSRSGRNGPWVTDFDEMARKTVVRRLAKYLPLTPEAMTHIAREDAAESGQNYIDIDTVSVDDIQPEPGESKAAAMAERLKGNGNSDATDAEIVDEKAPELELKAE